ncbi:SusC/RagA family TonB-linked outer membrane protein [Roseisolibacter agri]|uniref:SusC/RagA family TonB-linked outer membrane protein n=1 Tax=Roseisolibacter agri TaxID=2014610 RepID=A0AA37QCC4_9BACT|nr:SusC/RagA family TonB-linked outer membrane protein [Roseisolibacter agri]GLC27677.1 SusC/RagA family TonB-linked outer membrane protein [Roseisolibacter agri]
MSLKLVRATGLCLVPMALGAFAPRLVLAQATGTVRGRVIESGSQRPVPDAQVSVVGSTQGGITNAAGEYVIANVPVGERQLRARRIGFQVANQTVTIVTGGSVRADFTLTTAPAQLDQVVVTALGQTASQRSLGTAQQTVRGADIAEAQRPNFVNALQGRVAGVEVVSSSGVPGASSSITIRGVSSISSSNQPLMIIDGLPMDNKTLNTGVLASDRPGSVSGFNNRGVDFTNRAADLNPDDIESVTVLKGPEASALYGIDAANGAIVITTKRGRPGQGGLDYSNSFTFEKTNARPEVQRTYGVSGVGSTTFQYFGFPYPDTTTFYDNVDGFFRTGTRQNHNLSFSGAAADNRVNYRVGTSMLRQAGVVPGTKYDRVNVTGASGAQVASWLKADLSMQYTNAENAQSFKGEGGPLIGLLVWPAFDDASDWLTPAGQRRRLTSLGAASEVDNPYFNVNKNRINSTNNRILANLGLIVTPFSWGNLRTNIGVDNYVNQNQLMRHPESALGITYNGTLDEANDITRNINAQTLLNFNRRELGGGFAIAGLLGNAISDARSETDALLGQDFLDPQFVSINNTNLRFNRTTLAQRRLVSAFGQATIDFNEYLYLTVTGRNDWTSTIPIGENSFFYPSFSGSFVFSDAFPSLKRFMTGKLRGGYAEVGKDARPYAYRPSLEFKATSNGGYGYGFTGPNLALKPEFARSYEFGTELSFLDDRLGIDATVYRKQTKDQIVNDIRGSYATGYILFNLNGAVTRNEGLELTVRTTPVLKGSFSWDVLGNFEKARGKVLALPNALPESYVSDTWLFGNVRNGTAPNMSTRSLTGLFYLRATDGPAKGKLLIDPTTGLPLRSTTFIDAGYDRQPDFTIGVTNTIRFKKLSLSALVDIRKGGDVFNATQHFLTARGLATSTLDRTRPRVIDGVLRDGKENSANPTVNSIVVVPAVQTSYYTLMSEELFIEKDINWLRLRDVTLQYQLPARFARQASIFVTGTDLYLLTNYSGLDPIVNGNTAAVGGSGAAGIDYGNFPIPRGFNFGLRLGL